MTLGVFPKLKVVHTGEDIEGQIYIGSINYALMLLCIAVVAGFQADSVQLGNAYGEPPAYIPTVSAQHPVTLIGKHPSLRLARQLSNRQSNDPYLCHSLFDAQSLPLPIPIQPIDLAHPCLRLPLRDRRFQCHAHHDALCRLVLHRRSGAVQLDCGAFLPPVCFDRGR